MKTPRLTLEPRIHHAGGEEGVGGPTVKLWRMQHYFPNIAKDYNIIYSVSARISADVCRIAQRRGVKIVCHVNSVFHRAYRFNYQELNEPIAAVHGMADHVVYGSQFAKEGATRFLGPVPNSHTIICNAVDLEHFCPSPVPLDTDRFHILAIGVHYIRHRLETLIWAIPHVQKLYPQARLIIAGPLETGQGVFDCGTETIQGILRHAGVTQVEFINKYTQHEAPRIYGKGDVIVHMKHMDWTPNTVIEGMACGLPTVHAGNGGMTDLVGDAGLSLDMPFDWERIHTPDPVLLAERIIEAYERRRVLGNQAREIAVRHYDILDWVAAHQNVFDELLNRP